MLLIIEGPNYTGKSYIAQKLSMCLGLSIYKTLLSVNRHNDKSYQNAMKVYPSYVADLYVADLHAQVGLSMISERSFPSGYIYEDATDFQKAEWEKMIGHNAVILWLTASPEFLYERGKTLRNSDRGFSLEEIKNIVHKYEHYMITSKVPVIVIDVEDKETVLERAIKELQIHGFNQKR